MKQIREIIKLIRSKFTSSSTAELGWVFFGQLASVVLSFVILKILSSMGKEDFGVYALIITVTALLGLFYGPLQQGFLRFYYHYEAKESANIFIGYFYRILFFSGILFFLIAILFFLISLFEDFGHASSFFIAAGIFIISFKINEFFNAVLNLIRKRKENSLLQGAEKTITIIFLLTLTYLQNLNLTVILAGLFLITSGFAAIKIFIFNKFLPAKENDNLSKIPSIKKDIKKNLVMYFSPFVIWGIAAWLQLNGEKWIINGYLSTADVGIYAIMMALVNGLIIIPANIIADFSTPIIFKQYSDLNNFESLKLGENYIRINKYLVLGVTFFGAAITYFIGKELIILISSTAYAEYWYTLPLLCLGTGLFLTGQAQAMLGMALNIPQKYLAPKILTGLSSVIINLILIKNLGIIGVAYTSLIVGVFYVLYISIVNKNIVKNFK